MVELREAELTPILGRAGYRKVSRDTYLYGDGTCEVQHYLYLARSGERGRYLTAEFGLLQDAAHAFSRDMIFRYGGPLYRDVGDTISKAHCYMRFSLWRFCAMRGRRYWDTADPEAGDQIYERLNSTLVKFVTPIDSNTALLSVLLSDGEPCPWFAVNSAIRAAQVLHLAGATGRDMDEVAERLQSKALFISKSLPGAENADSYLETVAKEARSLSSPKHLH
jgi:hypothetical protein